MESSRHFLFLIGIFYLVFVRQTLAVCCTSREEILFTMKMGKCHMVGASPFYFSCLAFLCADGTPIKGRYCGRGKCNIFGCNCKGGCRTGEYRDSFLEKYPGYGIDIWNYDFHYY
ncbi:hypothetical protein KR054_009349 [Drosophila jambulina]|nr:hypothetical protein KR054_009349 [Drosophila jambulina]